jgi:hypothetical protein
MANCRDMPTTDTRTRNAFVLGTVGACTFLTGCSPSLSGAEADGLAADARPLLNAMCGSAGPVSPVNWPESLRLQKPQSVWVKADGLYIATSSFMASEWGIFVPCKPEQFKATPGTDPSFEKLGESAYSYHLAG